MTLWKSPWPWERLRAEREEGIRGGDGWMASLMQWAWTWASSRRWWRTGRPVWCSSWGQEAAAASAVSDSVQPHRRQPTRLHRPWDSPGKNTGVGCHCLLQCMKVKSGSEVAQSCPTLYHPRDCSLPGSSIHGIFQARVLEWVTIAFSRVKKRWTQLGNWTTTTINLTE